MKFIITENRMEIILDKTLNSIFPGFNNIENFGWANYGCGMGECCDPYAVGFVFPGRRYDDYFFKLVKSKYYHPYGSYHGDLPEDCYEEPNINDKEFDMVILYEEFGDNEKMEIELLVYLNKKFNFNASKLIFD
jgi:hypothetical protein